MAAGVPVYWDVCDTEGVKIQVCYVSVALPAGLAGLFFGAILDSPRTGSGECCSQMCVAGFAVGSQQETLKGFTTGPSETSQTRNSARFSRLHFRLFQVHPKFLGDSTHVTRSVAMPRIILTSA